MPPLESLPRLAPGRALRFARLAWGAFFITLLFFATLGPLRTDAAGVPPPRSQAFGLDIPDKLTLIASAILLVGVPYGLFLRGQIFKRNWVGHAVRPHAYLWGHVVVWNIVWLAGCVGLSAGLLGAGRWIGELFAAVGLVLLVLLYPNGRAMHPTPPER